jgi:ABC-2 type transport system ATP-binding protein
MAGLADGAGKTMTVECIQGLRRPGHGALSVLGYDPITRAARLRPLVRGQLEDSAVPNRVRVAGALDPVAGALDLFASPRARDGTQLLKRFVLGERGRWRFCSLSGPERQRLFLVLALPGRPGRTS